MATKTNSPLVPDDVVEIDIDSLDAAGDGIGRHRGRQIAVPFTIPGERVRVQVRREGGILLEVLRPSPQRVEAPCSHFGPDAKPGVCGGCTWQHIAYPEQLRLKTELVTRLVRTTLPGAPEARRMLPATSIDAPWHYRHKIHFVFGSVPDRSARNPSLVMGHYVRGSRRVVPVRECPVHAERGNALAFSVRDEYVRANVRATQPDASVTRGAPAARGSVKSLAIRVGCHTPEVMATLVVSSDGDKRLRTATRRVLDGPLAPTAFHVNVHPRGDAFIFGRDTRRLTGPERMRERVGGASFLVSPTAFFQTNIRAAEILVRLVLEALPPQATVLDLYAGAGLFAVPLALAGHTVLAVEENRAAVEDGEASARLNRVPPARCRFIARRVEAALRNPSKLGIGSVDAVVLDPPREGCTREVIDAVIGVIRPRILVYVSCNPEALARDLGVIAKRRYDVRSLQPVDMFPHTAHVECVAVAGI